jgi:lysine-N-methylase
MDDGDVGHVVRNSDGECTLLTANRLCSVQAKHGESMMPAICNAYPRKYVRAGSRQSVYATLGCPETARVALSDPHALDMVESPFPAPREHADVLQRKALGTGAGTERDDTTLDGIEASAELLAQTARTLITSPELSARQAWALFASKVHWILAMGVLAPGKSEVMASVRAAAAAAMDDSQIQQSGRVAEHDQLEDLPFAKRFSLAREAANSAADRASPSPVRQLLVQSLSGFDCDAEGALTARGLGQFAVAEQNWFEPFDRKHRHLLKNYLLNPLGLNNFPNMGLSGIGVAVADVALLLEVIRIFLVGRAQQRCQQFGTADYVMVAQAHSRYVVR